MFMGSRNSLVPDKAIDSFYCLPELLPVGQPVASGCRAGGVPLSGGWKGETERVAFCDSAQFGSKMPFQKSRATVLSVGIWAVSDLFNVFPLPRPGLGAGLWAGLR